MIGFECFGDCFECFGDFGDEFVDCFGDCFECYFGCCFGGVECCSEIGFEVETGFGYFVGFGAGSTGFEVEPAKKLGFEQQNSIYSLNLESEPHLVIKTKHQLTILLSRKLTELSNISGNLK